MNLLVTLVDNI